MRTNISRRFAALLAFAATGLLLSTLLPAQTVATGSIVGFVSDPQEKPVAGAKVEIREPSRGVRLLILSSHEGIYSSGPLQPGNYEIEIEAKGFQSAHLQLSVRAGNTSRADLTVQIATEKPRTAVQTGPSVNVEQATVQGVLEGELADLSPINARNIFDLGQLEPGVQTQDGGVIDPSENGIEAVSLLNHYGRATSVTVDGLNINNDLFGSDTQNVPASAVQEFQIAQSLPDYSNSRPASGAINIITRSGTNALHGELFGIFRGDQGAASLPGSPDSYFQREQYGGRAGGAAIKDKIFWFADAERSQQHLTDSEPFSFPFNGLNATLVQPYREFDTDERVDWNMRGSTRGFARVNFFENNDLRPFGSFSSTQRVHSINNTGTGALGFDFNTGVYAHSLRFEYLKLHSSVNDATSGLSAVDDPIPGLGINIGASTQGSCALSAGGSYCGGPSALAPEQLEQSNTVAKYDGGRILGTHVIHYGVTFDRIEAARLAMNSAFPQAGTTSAGNFLSSDPTSYAADFVTLSNGIGWTTNKSEFGLHAGALNPDNRLELYIGDRWAASTRLTVTYGLQYVHDTGRSDSNLGALPTLNQWGAGYGSKVRNPASNFAPQFGFAWDASGDGKTVIRGGAGLFYENPLGANVLYDQPARLANGIFADSPLVCNGSVANPFAWPVNTGVAGTTVAGGAGTVVANPTSGVLEVSPAFCGKAISTAAPQILALNSAYQAAAAGVTGSPANPNFLGTTLTALNPNYDLLYPGYRTPRAYQMNLGIEKEIYPGTIVSIDYLRNIGEHFLIGEDINHTGAARSFNQANAVAARDAAQVANGCSAGLNQATCMVAKLGQAGAQAAYSAAGLDSNLQTAGGAPCNYCAFPGTNSITGNLGEVGGVDMLFPVGRSLYSGLQAKVVQRINRPVYGVTSARFEFSYTLSRFVSQLQDQGQFNLATDNDSPTLFTGPNALNRKHQISFGGTFDLPLHIRFAAIGHFYSPVPQNLLLPELTHGGEIFSSDWLGAGLGASGTPEPVPGTKLGQLETASNVTNLDSVITSYNHTYANQFTPAGECLVAQVTGSPTNVFSCPGQVSGPQVMTPSDMFALGWVMPTLNSVAAYPTGIPWLKSMDARLAWPLKIHDRITLEPSASVFNVFNFWNAFLPGNLPGASLLPGQNGLLAPNVAGGVTPASVAPFRANYQSGTYALGTPRIFEFGLHVTF
ncbi:MAG TPA: carboxypeptidase regulatory-like domain-containing protein [Candidatus Binatia bacterium]|nr:carboxypeptidase regulatory-like domain-containing protein [Candidatus Binatia bacterium]